jgi:hypothetical protein
MLKSCPKTQAPKVPVFRARFFGDFKISPERTSRRATTKPNRGPLMPRRRPKEGEARVANLTEFESLSDGLIDIEIRDHIYIFIIWHMHTVYVYVYV